jgi:hypothetical protein
MSSGDGTIGATYVDAVKAIKTLMETFSTGTLEDFNSSGELLESLTRLETHERRQTTYALVAIAAATIRGTSMALDRDEFEVLREIAQGVGVDSNEV